MHFSKILVKMLDASENILTVDKDVISKYSSDKMQ